MSAEKKVEAIAAMEIDEIVKDIGKLKEELQKTTADNASRPNLSVVPDLPPAVETPAAPVENNAELQEFRGSGDDASLEETLSAMKDEEPPTSGKSLLDIEPATVAEEAPVESATPEEEVVVEAEVEAEVSRELKEVVSSEGEEGSLTLKLTGKMKLKLSYEYSGQEVTVCFDDDYLQVLMADGTEFKIPVQKKTTSSQAA